MGSPESSDVTRPFLKRLALINYKSIAACEVELSPFTALVGPNGAGKSNFLDSLRFVADSLRNSLEYALRDRGGINEVRRRSVGHPTHFSIRLDVNLPDGTQGFYAFRVGSSKAGGFVIQQEKCALWASAGAKQRVSHYHVQGGDLAGASMELPAAIEGDRLYLGVVSGLGEFRPLYDALTRMGFYNLNPAKIRELQTPDPAEILARDGGNLASVLGRLRSENGQVKQRIEEYLGAVVPGLKGVEVKHLGPKETIEFSQELAGAKHPWRFLASNMSDGTLRVLAVLVALFQGASRGRKPIPLVGIEEPEVALHPAATSALAEAMLQAADKTQVLVTSHSPDLLDDPQIPSESILAVVMERGETIIGAVDRASREALHHGLYTPGELLRLQQIQPEARPGRQLDLFADGAL